MDKVIIDGVDVNKCGYYKDGDCLLSPVTCEEFIDCDFKEIKRLQAENERMKARLRPLEDSYFNGLSSIQITELAKKSIRITAENRKLEYALQEIREYCEEQNLKADYTACEILAKINEVIGVE